MFDKKDREDVNRKSPCNDMTKQWLNLDGRGVLGYHTKADTRDTHPIIEKMIYLFTKNFVLCAHNIKNKQ